MSEIGTAGMSARIVMEGGRPFGWWTGGRCGLSGRGGRGGRVDYVQFPANGCPLKMTGIARALPSSGFATFPPPQIHRGGEKVPKADEGRSRHECRDLSTKSTQVH